MLNKILALLLVIVLLGGCGAGQYAPKMTGLGERWEARRSTPGTTLELIEVARRIADDGTTLIEYEPRASGQPRGKEYILRGRNTVSEPREIGRFAYNAEGRLVSKSSGEPLESHHMLVGQFQRGLVIMAALVATDGSAESFASATPFPIEGRDGPCRLWLEVLSPDGMAFSAHGEGFAPGELVRMTSHLDGEQMSLPLNALADGSLPVQLMFPATVGKGYRASLQARSSNCSPGVEYEWGPPAVKAR